MRTMGGEKENLFHYHSLHEGSILNPYLIALVVDELIRHI